LGGEEDWGGALAGICQSLRWTKIFLIILRILVFEIWEHLLDFALTPRKYNLSFHPP
jgi:hypothetical protein